MTLLQAIKTKLKETRTVLIASWLVLLLLVLVSWYGHNDFIPKHYQELDSWGVVYANTSGGRGFLQSSYENNPPPIFFQKRYNYESIKSTVPFFVPSDTTFKNIYDQLYASTNWGWQQTLRMTNLEYQTSRKDTSVTRDFIYNLTSSTTYFPGMGLFFGTFNGTNKDYHVFLEKVLTPQIILFHLSVLILFGSLLLLRLSPLAALAASIIYLYSITAYSYAFHLGSTFWVYMTMVIFMLMLAVLVRFPNRLVVASTGLVAGILLYFNYLMLPVYAIFWLVFFAWYRQVHLKKLTLSHIFSGGTFGLFAVYMLMYFIQPGESAKFGSDLPLPNIILYQVLNMLSCNNSGGLILDLILFATYAIILGAGAMELRKMANNKISISHFNPVLITLLGVILFYYIGCTPSLNIFKMSEGRHMLFMAIPLIVVIGYALSTLLKKDSNLNRMTALALVPYLVLAWLGTKERRMQVEKLDDKISLKNDYFTLVYGAAPFPIHNNPQGFPNSKGNWQYISIERPLDDNLVKDYSTVGSVQVLEKKSWEKNGYFSAYNPSRLPMTRPNNLHFALIEIK